jgi:sugar/nucleoside kinase (ribokinase family)
VGLTAPSLASISVIGNVNVDVILSPVEALPPPGHEWHVDRAEVRTGGAAANTAMALAALGASPRLVGSVGDDRLGQLLLEDLAGVGVNTRDVATEDGSSTGVSIAFEGPGRDRSFLLGLGSLGRFDGRSVAPGVLDADLVLVCGYFDLPAMRRGGTQRLLEGVREARGATLFDAGWDPGGYEPSARREVLDLLPLVTIFVPNELEASALARESDPEAAAASLQEASGGWVIVKLGPDGCVGAGPDGSRIRVSAPIVDALDTTGAGDAFNGVLAAGLAAGLDLEDAARRAVDAASASVRRAGARG